MTIPYRILRPDFPVEAGHYPVDSFSDITELEPRGVYTIARTYNGTSAIGLTAHLDRLEESAHLSGINVVLPRERLRSELRSLINQERYPETRFRITIPLTQPDVIILAVERLQPVPDELRRKGVAVATCVVSRPVPRAKTNAWLAQRKTIRATLPKDCYEGIIRTEKGNLKEGLSSNIYAILSGDLYTAEEDVLHGITRKIVLKLAAEKTAIKYKPIPGDAIALLEEAFLTSSSREVVPIVRIDGHSIGSGSPGPFTMQLADEYRSWVKANLVEI